MSTICETLRTEGRHNGVIRFSSSEFRMSASRKMFLGFHLVG